MMNCWAGLRRRAFGAVLGAACLLVGCGGGASRVAFVPLRLIVLGDETSVLNSDGSKYSVNALNAVDNSLLDCKGNPLWVQLLASAYGLTFSECPNGTAPVTALIFAVAGAQVSGTDGIAAQIDRVGGFVEKDLVTVLAGANDIFAQYALIKSGSQPEGSCTEPPNTTCTGAMAVVHATGEALAAQVNHIADLGGKVLISTVPDLGLTPFARSEEALTPGRAATLSRLTKEFNVRLRLNIINDGRRSGLLLIDETVQAVVKTPLSYGLVNVKDAVCIAGLAPTECTTLTLVTAPPLFPPASASNYLWANDRLFSSSGHALLGNLAYSRSSNNPF